MNQINGSNGNTTLLEVGIGANVGVAGALVSPGASVGVAVALASGVTLF